MKKIPFLFTIFIFLSLFSFSQQDTLNRIDNQGRKQGYWKKYDDKILLYEGQFINNVPTGKFTYYHKNGNIKSISYFINGTTKVKTTLFHDNGKKSSEGVFYNQLKDSIWHYYSEQGIKIKTESYKKGKKEGIWQTYSPKTGILLEEESYHKNILDGVYKTFYSNGDIQAIIYYINGKRNGMSESYYADSVLNMKGLYHNDFKEGKWSFFDVNGALRKVIDYKRSEEKSIEFIFYKGSAAQPINQEIIAYFQNSNGNTKVVLTNGKVFISTDELSVIRDFIDFVDFTPITPNIIAANNSIKGYKDISKDRIQVFLEPPSNKDIFSEGVEAKLVKSLFDSSEIIDD